MPGNFPVQTQTAVPTAGGKQTASFPAFPSMRVIERVNIVGPAGSSAALYVGSVDAVGFRDGSSSGDLDVAEYPSGLVVPGGQPVFIVWSLDTTPATVTIQFEREA